MPLSGKLKSLFNKLCHRTFFKMTNNLSKIINNNKNEIHENYKSGIYKFNSVDSGKFHLRITQSHCKSRQSEYFRSFRKGKAVSNYSNYLLTESRNFDFNCEILHSTNKKTKFVKSLKLINTRGPVFFLMINTIWLGLP